MEFQFEVAEISRCKLVDLKDWLAFVASLDYLLCGIDPKSD